MNFHIGLSLLCVQSFYTRLGFGRRSSNIKHYYRSCSLLPAPPLSPSPPIPVVIISRAILAPGAGAAARERAESANVSRSYDTPRSF